MIFNKGIVIAVALLSLCAEVSAGEKNYGPGVTDTEIKIGNTAPYSGPASAFGLIAKTAEAFPQDQRRRRH